MLTCGSILVRLLTLARRANTPATAASQTQTWSGEDIYSDQLFVTALSIIDHSGDSTPPKER